MQASQGNSVRLIGLSTYKWWKQMVVKIEIHLPHLRDTPACVTPVEFIVLYIMRIPWKVVATFG